MPPSPALCSIIDAIKRSSGPDQAERRCIIETAGAISGAEAAEAGRAAVNISMSPAGHIFFLAIGICLLLVILFAARHELRYFEFAKPSPFIRSFSILSFICMFALSLICILHFSIDFKLLVGLVGIFTIVLLIITPIQFYFRMKSFQHLTLMRRGEKMKLIREVTEILDENKRKKFIDSDASLSGEGKEEPPSGDAD